MTATERFPWGLSQVITLCWVIIFPLACHSSGNEPEAADVSAGRQLFVGLTKKTFDLSEEIWISLKVRNAGSAPTEFFAVHPVAAFHISIVGPDQQAIPRTQYAKDVIAATHSFRSLLLRPGAEGEYRLHINRAWEMTSPGPYRIAMRERFPPSGSAPLRCQVQLKLRHEETGHPSRRAKDS